MSYTTIEIVERFLRLDRGELIDMIEKLEKENKDLQNQIEIMNEKSKKEEKYSDSEILEFELEHQQNLTEIEELERFIENVCDSEEDEEEPLSKIEELKEMNEELEQKLN